MAGFFSQIAQKIIPGSSGVAVKAISGSAFAQQVKAASLAAAEQAGEGAASNAVTLEEIQIVASPAPEESAAASKRDTELAWQADERNVLAAIDAFVKAPDARDPTDESALRSLVIEFFSAREPGERVKPHRRSRARRQKAAPKQEAAPRDQVEQGNRIETMWYFPGPSTVLGEDAVLRALVSQSLLRAAFAGASTSGQQSSALIEAFETLAMPQPVAGFRHPPSDVPVETTSAAAAMPPVRESARPSEGTAASAPGARPAQAGVVSAEAPAAPVAGERPKPASRPAGAVGATSREGALPNTAEAGARRFLAQATLSPTLAALMRAALPVAPLEFRPASSKGLIPRVFAGRLGDRSVQVHYLPHEGRLVFAGWQEAAASEARREQAANGALNAALASGLSLPTPDPVHDTLIAIYGFGRPGADADRQPVFDGRDASLGERLALAVAEQLSKGPESMREGGILRSLNAQLAAFAGLGPSVKLAKADWEALLTRALSIAIGSVPVMDRGGLRPLSTIQDDAASLLGMDVEMFYRWEDHFGVDSVAEHLFGDELEAPRRRGNKALVAKLSRALDERMAELAMIAMGPPEGEIGIKRPEELKLQWTAARLSMAPSADQKAAAAFELIQSLAREGNVKAGRLLALIARHSIVNASPSKGEAFAPRWTQEELTLLLKALMGSDAWAVSSHRSFRGFLTPAENATLNALIHSANFAAAVDVMRGIDILQVEEEDFWQALDETGRAEVFMDTAIAKMGLFKPDYLE